MSVTVPIQLVDPTNATDKETVQSANVEGRLLEFRVGEIDGVQHAWTRLMNAKSGDEIWINMTTDGGKTWKSFGRRTIQEGGRNYTDALRTDASDKVKMQGWARLKPSKKEYNTASW